MKARLQPPPVDAGASDLVEEFVAVDDDWVPNFNASFLSNALAMFLKQQA